jgi:hypothetical protein
MTDAVCLPRIGEVDPTSAMATADPKDMASLVGRTHVRLMAARMAAEMDGSVHLPAVAAARMEIERDDLVPSLAPAANGSGARTIVAATMWRWLPEAMSQQHPQASAWPARPSRRSSVNN